MSIWIRSVGSGLSGLLTLAAIVGASSLAAGQSPTARPSAAGRQLKVGILPFADATSSGNHAAGMDVGRTMQAEMVHSTSLLPRILTLDGSIRADDLDGEKAVAIGREQHVDLVFMGTVLDANTEESNRSGWIPTFKGQSGNVRIRRIKAKVTLQGELYDVASGSRLFSERITGNESDNKFGGTLYTRFGAWGNDSYGAFLESPLGKALHKALVDMTKKVAQARP